MFQVELVIFQLQLILLIALSSELLSFQDNHPLVTSQDKSTLHRDPEEFMKQVGYQKRVYINLSLRRESHTPGFLIALRNSSPLLLV